MISSALILYTNVSADTPNLTFLPSQGSPTLPEHHASSHFLCLYPWLCCLSPHTKSLYATGPPPPPRLLTELFGKASGCCFDSLINTVFDSGLWPTWYIPILDSTTLGSSVAVGTADYSLPWPLELHSPLIFFLLFLPLLWFLGGTHLLWIIHRTSSLVLPGN